MAALHFDESTGSQNTAPQQHPPADMGTVRPCYSTPSYLLHSSQRELFKSAMSLDDAKMLTMKCVLYTRNISFFVAHPIYAHSSSKWVCSLYFERGEASLVETKAKVRGDGKG